MFIFMSACYVMIGLVIFDEIESNGTLQPRLANRRKKAEVVMVTNAASSPEEKAQTPRAEASQQGFAARLRTPRLIAGSQVRRFAEQGTDFQLVEGGLRRDTAVHRLAVAKAYAGASDGESHAHPHCSTCLLAPSEELPGRVLPAGVNPDDSHRRSCGRESFPREERARCRIPTAVRRYATWMQWPRAANPLPADSTRQPARREEPVRC